MTRAATLTRLRPARPFRASRQVRMRLAALLVPALLLMQLTCVCILPAPAAVAATAAHDCCPGGDADGHGAPPGHDRACGHCAVGPSLPDAPAGPTVPARPDGARLGPLPLSSLGTRMPGRATTSWPPGRDDGGARARLRQRCVLVL